MLKISIANIAIASRNKATIAIISPILFKRHMIPAPFIHAETLEFKGFFHVLLYIVLRTAEGLRARSQGTAKLGRPVRHQRAGFFHEIILALGLFSGYGAVFVNPPQDAFIIFY